jgi:hypothetical protein
MMRSSKIAACDMRPTQEKNFNVYEALSKKSQMEFYQEENEALK